MFLITDILFSFVFLSTWPSPFSLWPRYLLPWHGSHVRRKIEVIFSFWHVNRIVLQEKEFAIPLADAFSCTLQLNVDDLGYRILLGRGDTSSLLHSRAQSSLLYWCRAVFKTKGSKILGWPKSLFGFFLKMVQNIQMNFLANPIKVNLFVPEGGEAERREEEKKVKELNVGPNLLCILCLEGAKQLQEAPPFPSLPPYV